MKKIALITGAAIRIGKEIAKYLLSNNWIVVIHYNNSVSAIEKFKSELDNKSAYFIKADLSNQNEIIDLIKMINDEIGIINLLINNASVFENDDLDSFNINKFNKHLNVNLIAPIILTKEFKKQIIEQSNIINIVDYCVKKFPKNFLSYSLTKSALWNLTQILSQTLAPSIRINAIGPGAVIPNQRQSDENFDKLYRNSPLGYGTEIKEICNAIDFILNNKSITGQLIMLDSGKHLSNLDYQ